jgi:uncharacterized protein (TIGR02646 family)
VNTFRRRPAPGFWKKKEAEWLARTPRSTEPLRDLKHEKRVLAAWFHDECRQERDVRLCAYCDGSLTTASQETIDHYYPVHVAQLLALNWENLYPACNRCNTTNKGTKYSCGLLRPDVDPVEELIDFDLKTGRLRAAPGVSNNDRVRVLLTCEVLGLNAADRCSARLRVVQNVFNAKKPPPDNEYLDAMVNRYEYRFVARRALLALADVS